MIRLFGEK